MQPRQYRTLRIPAGDRELRADLHSIKRMAGQTGTPRLVVDDDAGESRSHADRFWALALACGALEGRRAEIGYTPVRETAPAPDADDDDDNADRWGGYVGAGADWRAG